MSLRLHPAPIHDMEILRKLIIDDLRDRDEIYELIDAKWPAHEHALLTINRRLLPTLVVFHPMSGLHALQDGLRLLEEWTDYSAWIARLYPRRADILIDQLPHLTLYIPHQVSGFKHLCSLSPTLTVYTFQILLANNEPTLLVTPLRQDAALTTPQPSQPSIPPTSPRGVTAEGLSEEERAFFRIV